MKLIGELIGTIEGPILVIGGGPSVSSDLARLKELGAEPAAVLSANDHGFRQSHYAVTYAVTVAATHRITGEDSRTYLTRAGARSIIAPGFCADYRIPDFTAPINSGLLALVVAAALGGSPVIVTGIDCYRMRDKHAPTYFHTPTARSNSNKKKSSNFARQFLATRTLAKGAPIRPMSGPLLDFWPAYDPNEALPAAPPLPEIAQTWRETRPVVVDVVKPWSHTLGRTNRGQRLTLSTAEARGFLNSKHVRLPAAV